MTTYTLLAEGSTMSLAVKVLSYTAFYAALTWLPLRFGCIALGRIRDNLKNRKEPRPAGPPSASVRYVIR